MKVTKDDRNNLIALCLGDGYLSKNGHIEVFHSKAQRELVEYKYSLVKKYAPSGIVVKRKKDGEDLIGFRTKRVKFLKVLRRVLYKDSKKEVTNKLLLRLNTKHLAILWMDDGCRSVNRYTNTEKIKSVVYELCVCSTKEQADIYLNWIESLTGVKFRTVIRKNKYFSLRCSTQQGIVFSRAIKKYVVPSLSYKVDHS